MLSSSESRLLTKAIKNGSVIKFRYYTQKIKGKDKTTNALQKFRFAIAIKKKFGCLLGLFEKGASYSVSRGLPMGYRLYKVTNMWDLSIPKTFDGLENFSKVNMKNYNHCDRAFNILFINNLFEKLDHEKELEKNDTN